jgi:hypothetical protein
MKNFADVIALLRDTNNETVILQGPQNNHRLVVAPQLVGRVMASTMTGDQGTIQGWVNQSALEAGAVDPVFNNYGGEERFWLGPDGTSQGLFFRKKPFTWDNFYVPEPMSAQLFETIALAPDHHSITMQARWKLSNLMGAKFHFEITRTITILDACPYANGLGDKINYIGFQSDNLVRNVSSSPITPDTGAVSMWLLGNFMQHRRNILILPLTPSPISPALSPIRDEYFRFFCAGGKLPENRLQNSAGFSLIKADGAFGAKFGIAKTGLIDRLGAIDLDADELIIIDYDFYPDMDYLTNYWREADNLLDGDAANISIAGPPSSHPVIPESLGYELETLSPGLFLAPGQSFHFRNRTFRFSGPQNAIDLVCHRHLHASRTTLETFDLNSRLQPESST